MSSRASDPDPEAEGSGFVAACTVLAGPNGSGKSSLYDLLQPDGEFVNADVIARASALGQAEAARRTIERLDDLLNGRKSFVYETTLSSHQAIALMGRARAVGYEVGLVYVALVDADLNVRRVAERVSRGGHDIPEATIRRRYPRALSNVARAVPLAHGSLFYDNSEPTPALLLRISDGVIEENNLKDACAHHRPIAEAVARALSVDADAIFRAAREGGAVRR